MNDFEQEMRDALPTPRHYHTASPDDMDTCADCGRNVRNPIHRTFGDYGGPAVGIDPDDAIRIMKEAVAAERERIRSEEWIAFMQQLEVFPHQDEDECLALGRIRAWMLNVPDTNNAINQENLNG